ncbi:Pkinase-domain-containing protein [Dendrothele bispora CBS 962.96]|uniref:Pkinase-domain-containing protein n=1 Tax=Dendrothele bispora (strain CBS 962.96) TaxID=1314807 RepID=A0A4S8LV04_DENBC|nr:Pkinase-domain-containing protein [Dendrothele bispora CBS 962.96]
MSEAAQASKAQKVAKPQDLHSSDFTFCEVDDGKLLLLEELGSGAYGRVYKAIDAIKRDKNRKFAVKCLRKFEKNSRDEMFQMREFVLHKKVSSHPNVVNFYDAFCEHDHVFVVLELCEGGDLFTAIVNHGLFEGNDKLIKSCFTQILDGLYHCHRKLVFHRDLKPENILCSKDGTQFRLADFGLATDQQESQSYGCGSAEYMSPECIGKEFGFGKKPYSTAQNDIWALGIILINLITARSPWKHAGTEDHCFSNFLENPTWLLDSLPISSSVFALMMIMLQLQPKDRIDSIPEIRRMLVAIDTFYALDFIEDTIIRISSPVVRNPSVCVQLDCHKKAASGIAELCAYSDSASSEESLSSNGSDSDSVGPITPGTYPVRPELEVPDIEEDEAIAIGLDPTQPLDKLKDDNSVKPIGKEVRDCVMDTDTFGLGAVEAANTHMKAMQSTHPCQQVTSPLITTPKIHHPLPVRAEARGDRDGHVEGRVANIVKTLEELCVSPSQKGPAGPVLKTEQVQPEIQDVVAVDQRNQRDRGAIRRLFPRVNIRARLSEFL